jgi:hypothetical protein
MDANLDDHTEEVVTMPLSEVLLGLAKADIGDPILRAGLEASVSVLTEGVMQMTRACADTRTHRKHLARLRQALRAMAAEAKRFEPGGSPPQQPEANQGANR